MFVCGCSLASLYFLTVLYTYMQLDLPQIHHRGHAKETKKYTKQNVTSLHKNVCFYKQRLCVAARLTGQIHVVHPEGATGFQLQEGSAAQ